jgi:hypothetical protein|tara:strand:- start:363 stop:593 length:231 start_codon:yes stop_codon:yes gene_type:complete
MMKFNNIVVEHHGVELSIAQHKDKGTTFIQEIMVIGGSLDGQIFTFDNSLTGLSSVLVQIEEELNRKENDEKARVK